MMTWEEINKIKDRKVYEYEYSVRKTYERLVPIVDELYAVFAIYAQQGVQRYSQERCEKVLG